MLGTIKIRTRPIKLAFLVDPKNGDQVREAIRLSSTLWGGASFPIIPLYKRMPATWREKPFRTPRADDVIRGYIEAFDPDILVQLSMTIPSYISKLDLHVINPAEIWARSDNEDLASPRFGLGIFELLNDVFDKHFKYTAKYPVRVIIPAIPKRYSLFWASVFGEVPSEILDRIRAEYAKHLEIEFTDLAPDAFPELLKGNMLFPRRLTQHGLITLRRSRFRSDAVAFFMDATEIADIVDYWNLRALGKAVVPIPKHLRAEPRLREFIEKFLKDHRRPWKHNRKVCDLASIIPSRHSTVDEVQEFTKTLRLEREPDDPSEDPFVAIQHWQPRVWDEWARDKDGAVPPDIYGDAESSIELPDTKQPRITLPSLLPAFAEKWGYHGEPRCANEIEYRIYGNEDYLAEVFPKSSGDSFLRAISGLVAFIGGLRIGRNGLVRLVRDDLTGSFEIPSGESIVFAWLADNGWKARLSSPGMLAKEIRRMLGGFALMLRNEKLLGLLEHMSGGQVKKDLSPVSENKLAQPRELTVGEVKTRLAAIPNRTALHDNLISHGVFQLGLQTQCPRCQRNSWFPLDSIRDTLTCPRCLNAFPALGVVDQGKWCYKTAGPFSVPNYADGAYAVLLALEFFSNRSSASLRVTPAFSFTAESPNKKTLEADFALFWQDSVFGESHDGILFGESKTYNTFEARDFARMKFLAQTFPGALLVFSTLRKTLTASEITGIARLAKAGRKYWKAERPINPVLVLTGTELLRYPGPPACWEKPIKKQFANYRGLIGLCNATQQIYLNLPSWEQHGMRRRSGDAGAGR